MRDMKGLCVALIAFDGVNFGGAASSSPPRASSFFSSSPEEEVLGPPESLMPEHLSSLLPYERHLDEENPSVSMLCSMETDTLHETNTFLQRAQANIETERKEIDDLSDLCNEDLRCFLNYTEAFGEFYRYACQDDLQKFVELEAIVKCDSKGNGDPIFYNEQEYPYCVSSSCSDEEAQAMILPFLNSILQRIQETFASTHSCSLLTDRTTVFDVIPSLPSPPELCERYTEFSIALNETLSDATESVSLDIQSFDPWNFCVGQQDGCMYSSPVAVEYQDACSSSKMLYLQADLDFSCTAIIQGEQLDLQLLAHSQPLCLSETYCTSPDMYNIFATSLVDQWTSSMLREDFNCTLEKQSIYDPMIAPTISPAPSLSALPSEAPSISSVPTLTPDCVSDSVELNATSAPLQALLNDVQGAMDSQAFGTYCKFPSDALAIPFVVRCELDYSVAAVPGPTKTENQVQQICNDLGGEYVENTYMITCLAADAETYIIHKNRPSCRSKMCFDESTDGLDKLETLIQLDMQWYLDGLERGDEGEENVGDSGTTCLIQNVQTIFGDALIPPLELNETCYNSTVLEIAEDRKVQNAHTEFRNAFMNNFPGNHCNMDVPEQTVCSVNMQEVLETTVDGDASSTDVFVDACGNSGGDMALYEANLSCQRAGIYLTVDISNMRRCIGKPCTQSEAEFHISRTEDIATSFTDQGYECTTAVRNVEVVELIKVTPFPSAAPSIDIGPTTPVPTHNPGTNGGGLTFSSREGIFDKGDSSFIVDTDIDGSDLVARGEDGELRDRGDGSGVLCSHKLSIVAIFGVMFGAVLII